MHQSSHRILRWTDDDRPYTRDFQDLFCTLMVAVELKTHRVKLRQRQHTFTTGEAIDHLGNLRFTQSNRRPSPTDPNVTVTTKIATTFSMVPHMARYLCLKFLAARFIESLENKTTFDSADSVWQLTPKGISLLQSFAHRNGVNDQRVYDLLESPRNTMHLLVLERDPETDKLNGDHATLEVIFRRFAGLTGPNTKQSNSSSDTDSINDVPNGLSGVKLFKEKRIGSKVHEDTFSGKAAVEWLMNCCTLVDEREAHETAALFVQYGFIVCLQDDKQSPSEKFNCSKGSVYTITGDGRAAAKWTSNRKDARGSESPRLQAAAKEPNSQRMLVILTTPSLRLVFREFLRDTHCEENLVFYLEVKDFLGKWAAVNARYGASSTIPLDIVRETLAGAYDLYNAFLAPGSPCELNIDHSLRTSLVARMTRFELPDHELLQNVAQVIELYKGARDSVFKLMASDSVPKFLRDPRYSQALYENSMDGASSSSGPSPVTVVPTAA